MLYYEYRKKDRKKIKKVLHTLFSNNIIIKYYITKEIIVIDKKKKPKKLKVFKLTRV